MHNLGRHSAGYIPQAPPQLPRRRYRASISTWVHQLILISLYSPRRAIHRAVKYLHAAQRPEGGWYGSWGICFTYATQFALESLSLVGETYATSERSRRACKFLVGKQRADGGWGESYKVR